MANLAIDLDGTLATWGHVPGRVGEWLPGAADAVRAFLRGGHRVLVHSCRATWEEGGGTEEIERFLLLEGFVPRLVIGREQSLGSQGTLVGSVHNDDLAPSLGQVGIWVGIGKPIAHAYVDDRGVRFGDHGWTPGMVEFVLTCAAS